MAFALRIVALALSFALVACGSSSRQDIAKKDFVLYLALGASDALGVGAVPVTNGYVYRLRSALDRPINNVILINLAGPGWTVEPIAETARTFLQTHSRPDIVTLWTGPNDIIRGHSVGDFEAELRKLLARLRETRAVVAVATIPDLTQLPRFRTGSDRDVTPKRIAAFNAVIAREVRRQDAILVDLFAVPLEAEYVSNVDGFHPSNAGHAPHRASLLRRAGTNARSRGAANRPRARWLVAPAPDRKGRGFSVGRQDRAREGTARTVSVADAMASGGKTATDATLTAGSLSGALGAHTM